MDRSLELEAVFACMKQLLVDSHHKVFDVTKSRFRTTPALIAIRPIEYKQNLSVFVLRVFRNKVEYGWLMPHGGDENILKKFSKEFTKKDVRKNARMFSYIRQENWQDIESLVAKEQRDEFKVLIVGTPLS
jgi:DNA-directed RNA polymerase alpha subunit